MTVEFPDLGDIVALHSHPYFLESNTALISGEAQMLSPLMIIVEILEESTENEKGVADDTSIRRRKCKCLWYSHKSHKFEEDWIQSDLLKLVQQTEFIDEYELRSKQVIFKTLRLEIGKQKSSTSGDLSSDSEMKSTTISPLLSFVSPVMQVLEVKDNLEAVTRASKAKAKRILSAYLVKCKWFNPLDNKMSESFLPIEALQILDVVNQDRLKEIELIITDGSYFKINSGGQETIVKPQKILFRNGLYYLQCYDFIENKSRADLEINTIKWPTLKEYFLDSAPKFSATIVLSSSVLDMFKKLDSSKAKNFLRIKYLNNNQIISYRTIKEWKLIVGSDPDSESYVTGYCCLRKQERTFKISGIQKLEQLKVEFS